MSLASFNALIERQLAIAEKADPHHCSRCGRHLGRWYYGFPLPLCPICVDIDKWMTCPCCGWMVRQDPPGSRVLGVHGGRNWVPCPESGKQIPADPEAAPRAAGTEE